MDIDPQLWRPRFSTWAQSLTVPIAALLSALDRRTWPLKEGCELELVRLTQADLALLKQQIAERIFSEHGGEFRTNALVFRSDGQTFTVSLPV